MSKNTSTKKHKKPSNSLHESNSKKITADQPIRKQLQQLEGFDISARHLGKLANTLSVNVFLGVCLSPLCNSFDVEFHTDENIDFYLKFLLSILGHSFLTLLVNNFLPYGIFKYNIEKIQVDKIRQQALESSRKGEEIIKDLQKKLVDPSKLRADQFNIAFTDIIRACASHGYSTDSTRRIIAYGSMVNLFLTMFYGIYKLTSSRKNIKIDLKNIQENLNYITKDIGSKWNDANKSNRISFDIEFNKAYIDIPITPTILSIPFRIYQEKLIASINKVKPKAKFFTDDIGILISNIYLTEQEAKEIHNNLLVTLNEWYNFKKNKPAHNQFIGHLSAITSSLLIWYRDNEALSKTNSTQFTCASNIINNWTNSKVEAFIKLLGQHFDANNITIRSNRFVITETHEINDETKQALKNFCEKNPKSAVSATKTTQIVSQETMSNNSSFTIWANYFQQRANAAIRYLPNLFQSHNESEKASTETPIIKYPAAQTFKGYQNVREYNPDEITQFETTLKEKDSITIPYLEEGHTIGFISLKSKTLRKLPDNGVYLLGLLTDHLKNGGGHFINLSKTSKFSREDNAKAKIRLFGKDGGDDRGILIKIEPTGPEKIDMPVYKFSLRKH